MKTGMPEIVFILPDILGGVASFNRNIVNNASLRKQAYVKVILVSEYEWKHPRITETFDADEVVAFQYGYWENRYAVLKRLSDMIGPDPGAVVCNDALEMGSLYEYGTPKTVYQLVHDFYNLKLAVRYGDLADVFLTHTGLFRDVLISSDPVTVQAFHLQHGVNIPAEPPLSAGASRLKIVFTGRLVESKGVQDIYEIDNLLAKAGVDVEWTIIGRGPLKPLLEEQWKEKSNVRFVSPDTTEELLALMATHDIFILPTRFEGSPVTILEALATGLVPVVSDLPGGIRETVPPEVGRRVPVGDNQQFADTIAGLHRNRELLAALKTEARKQAVAKYDIRVTSDNYFGLLLQYASLKKEHKNRPPLSVGFRLDKKWIPNVVVSLLRRGIRTKKETGGKP